MQITPENINPSIRALSSSATVALNELSNGLVNSGRSIIKFGLGQSPFPIPEHIVAALREHAHEKDYLPVRGLPPLREVIRDYLRPKTEVAYATKNIFIGPGSKELMFLLQLVLEADLLLPQGSWVSYAPQAQIVGRGCKWLSANSNDKWRFDLNELETVGKKSNAKPKLLILNYPSNPTGQTFSDDELKEIASICRHNGMIVLADEIYGELDFSGRYASIAKYYPEGTIVSSGLSKWCGAGGWRLGMFAAPNEMNLLIDKLAVAASETFTSVSAPIQFAAIEAFKPSPDIDRYLFASRAILAGINEMVAKILISAGVAVAKAEGGFYLFPDFSHFRDRLKANGINTSAGFTEALLKEAGVAILPGSCFGFAPEQLLARIAFVDFDGKEALAAFTTPSDITDNWVRQHCPNVAIGAERIAAFLEKLSS